MLAQAPFQCSRTKASTQEFWYLRNTKLPLYQKFKMFLFFWSLSHWPVKRRSAICAENKRLWGMNVWHYLLLRNHHAVVIGSNLGRRIQKRIKTCVFSWRICPLFRPITLVAAVGFGKPIVWCTITMVRLILVRMIDLNSEDLAPTEKDATTMAKSPVPVGSSTPHTERHSNDKTVDQVLKAITAISIGIKKQNSALEDRFGELSNTSMPSKQNSVILQSCYTGHQSPRERSRTSSPSFTQPLSPASTTKREATCPSLTLQWLNSMGGL